MPSTEALKVAVLEAIDRRGPELIEVATTILHHPEPGFREQKTSQLTARKFREFGIPFQDGIALTGLKGMLETGSAGPSACRPHHCGGACLRTPLPDCHDAGGGNRAQGRRRAARVSGTRGAAG